MAKVKRFENKIQHFWDFVLISNFFTHQISPIL